MKTRLKKSNSELTTNCSQLKLTAADGKKYATDCFIQDDIITLVKAIPSKKETIFSIGFYTAITPSTDKAERKLLAVGF